MPEGSLARRYAKAFLEITTRAGVVDPVGKDLLQLAEIFEQSRELRVALENPAIDRASRKAVLAEVLRRQGANPETRRLVEVLVDRDRLGVLRQIAQAYGSLADERAGRVRAEVISAERLDEARLGQIQRALERVTGKRVVIEHGEDPALLAGVVSRIGSWVYDGSLRSQMAQLRDTLLAE
jgi:F-type H+-transporting ATPase subunit delta